VLKKREEQRRHATKACVPRKSKFVDLIYGWKLSFYIFASSFLCAFYCSMCCCMCVCMSHFLVERCSQTKKKAIRANRGIKRGTRERKRRIHLALITVYVTLQRTHFVQSFSELQADTKPYTHKSTYIA